MGRKSRLCSTPSASTTSIPLIGDTPAQAVADQAHRAWVDFITDGDPGWPAYNITGRITGLLSDHIDVASDPAASDRVCWDQIR